MKKITTVALAFSLLAAIAVSGCATTESGGSTARTDGKDREISTGTRLPQR